MKNKYLKNEHWRNKLQHTGSHYNTLQHTNNTLQHTNKRITVCSPTKWPCTIHCNTQTQYTATHKQAYHCIYIIMKTKYQRYADWRKILQHTATYCNTLQHTKKRITASTMRTKYWRYADWRKLLQHTAAHCNSLQHTETHKQVNYTESTTSTRYSRYQHRRKYCNTLQHTTTYCNTLQHTRKRILLNRQWIQHLGSIHIGGKYCNTLQHTTTYCYTLQHKNKRVTLNRQRRQHIGNINIRDLLWYTVTHCNTLQHTATHCNTQTSALHWIDENEILEM